MGNCELYKHCKNCKPSNSTDAKNFGDVSLEEEFVLHNKAFNAALILLLKTVLAKMSKSCHQVL